MGNSHAVTVKTKHPINTHTHLQWASVSACASTEVLIGSNPAGHNQTDGAFKTDNVNLDLFKWESCKEIMQFDIRNWKIRNYSLYKNRSILSIFLPLWQDRAELTEGEMGGERGRDRESSSFVFWSENDFIRNTIMQSVKFSMNDRQARVLLLCLMHQDKWMLHRKCISDYICKQLQRMKNKHPRGLYLALIMCYFY